MINEITKKLNSLNKLKETAHNSKILWEEMKIVSEKSFKLQEEILELINKAEETEENITALQTLFETRELVWDIINDITTQEMVLKEATHTKATKKECKSSCKGKCATKRRTQQHKCDCQSGCCCGHKHN